MQEMWVWSLGQEDPLEEEMATHSSILAWKTPWTEEPGGLTKSHKESDTTATEHMHAHDPLRGSHEVLSNAQFYISAWL